MHTRVPVYVYVRNESESVSHSSPAQGCPSDLCMCVRACVLVLFHQSPYCVYLSASVHRDTKTYTHTDATLKTQANTCQVMIKNPSFVLKEGNTIAHPHKHSHQGTSTHIKVLTSSATCLGKRWAAAMLYPCPEDPADHLAWGRSLCARAGRRSRR
jgi:hypothetical protein